MEPSLKQQIDDLRLKFESRRTTEDLADLENCMRQFKTELFIKRSQVEHLRCELDKANEEIHELKRSTEKTKNALEENQFNFNLVSKSYQQNEIELKEKRDGLLKIQLQYKLMVAEIDSLREKAQKADMEKVELIRKVEVLEEKHRYDSAYHNEILKKDAQLKSFMGDIQLAVGKLQAEQAQAIELAKHSTLADESLQKCTFLVEKVEKIMLQKQHFEEQFVSVSAKYEKLKELLNLSSEINEPNLPTKIIFYQWKLNQSHYKAEITLQCEIISKLTEAFAKEKSTNINLIAENEVLCCKVKELEEKLNFAAVIHDSETEAVKSEPIEIMDD